MAGRRRQNEPARLSNIIDRPVFLIKTPWIHVTVYCWLNIFDICPGPGFWRKAPKFCMFSARFFMLFHCKLSVRATKILPLCLPIVLLQCSSIWPSSIAANDSHAMFVDGGNLPTTLKRYFFVWLCLLKKSITANLFRIHSCSSVLPAIKTRSWFIKHPKNITKWHGSAGFLSY